MMSTICACPRGDADDCVRVRYHLSPIAHVDDPCSCPCHDESESDEDGGASDEAA